jgi:microcystin degradation protein MlrC
MKLFVAGLATETNTFAPLPTGRADYAVQRLDFGQPGGEVMTGVQGVAALLQPLVEEQGWTVVSSILAGATPAGRTVRAAYEGLRDEILDDLRAAMPVDAVAYNLHGAMVADGYDDCEGDLLARTRAIVGPDVPVGAVLDPHCHLTQQMVNSATALIAQKEYPHVDYVERLGELLTLLAEAASGRIHPHTSVYDCRMVGVYHTTRQPMRGYVDRLTALEGQEDVLSISVAHGFPWGDVSEMGTKVWAITDNRPELGSSLAATLGRELIDMRDEVRADYLTIKEGLDRALGYEHGPVILADSADNAGGGAPSDSTFVLRAMLERGITDAAVACIWDPVAVSIASSAGLGARLDIRIGGKVGPVSGDPLDLHVEVIGVHPDARQWFGPEGAARENALGAAVAVRCAGIDIVLNSQRTQVFSPHCFTEVGIDPTQKQILVVKSSQHFYARFAPLATEVLYLNPPGALTLDWSSLPYERFARDIYPFVENPWGDR